VYAHVWRSKGIVTRLLAWRQQEVQRSSFGSETSRDEQNLRETRRSLERWTYALPGPDRTTAIEQLTARKEQLERHIAQRLQQVRGGYFLDSRPHAELYHRLPVGTAFVDLLRYCAPEQASRATSKASQRDKASYVAFVTRSNHAAVRVDLGPAQPIDTAVSNWRAEISAARRHSNVDKLLRRIVWEPIEEHLGGTHTVLLSPDAALTAIPWTALPGRKEKTVLLEDYAVAVIPHGQFLLDQLMLEPVTGKQPATAIFLGLGGVRYTNAPYLPGTKRELDAIVEMAASSEVRQVQRFLRVVGSDATQRRLTDELPRVQWAHLATHGFFADRQTSSVFQVDPPAAKRFGLRLEGTEPRIRNPMTLSGLVLADELPLTAETIATCPLGNLDQVVLSACDTGLGEVAGGEGVLGLQRAFHQSGVRTTVASLWKVHDAATEVLMVEFYHNLWNKRLGKLESLRQAQLAMLRGELQDKMKQAESASEPLSSSTVKATPSSGHPRHWAAWVLSGDWR
jgi:CHAT domain-containing protein